MALTVSIDSGMQFAAERELESTMRERDAKSGSVVLMDPWNGEILAMASSPGFDPNQYGRYPAEARRNRAIADAYEPGSTFKIVTGSTALEKGPDPAGRGHRDRARDDPDRQGHEIVDYLSGMTDRFALEYVEPL